ncbi:MAG: GNAT family N-acetyltransferase [Cycloclasticus sp.]
MHINKANLSNLMGLWRKYGSRPNNEGALPLRHANIHWPHRYWFDENTDDIAYPVQDYSNDSSWLNDVPDSAVIPVWFVVSDNKNGDATPFLQQHIEKQLLENNWRCVFEQTAMYKELPEEVPCIPLTRVGFQVIKARSSEDIKKWVGISSEAFAYDIDLPVIEKLFNDKDIQILVGWQDEQAVASALLYKTGDIVGIHQVGVKKAFQGQGIARYFMHKIIMAGALWQAKHIVLQASQAGQPLYESLGFRAQFTIKNYQRI